MNTRTVFFALNEEVFLTRKGTTRIHVHQGLTHIICYGKLTHMCARQRTKEVSLTSDILASLATRCV